MIYIILCMKVLPGFIYVYHMLAQGQKGIRSTGTGTTDSFELLLESNPGSVEEQWVLLSTESYLQPQNINL